VCGHREERAVSILVKNARRPNRKEPFIVNIIFVHRYKFKYLFRITFFKGDINDLNA